MNNRQVSQFCWNPQNLKRKIRGKKKRATSISKPKEGIVNLAQETMLFSHQLLRSGAISVFHSFTPWCTWINWTIGRTDPFVLVLFFDWYSSIMLWKSILAVEVAKWTAWLVSSSLFLNVLMWKETNEISLLPNACVEDLWHARQSAGYKDVQGVVLVSRG